MSGLEGVVVADTRLSKVDGARGCLLIAGLPVEEFASSSFEAAAARLLEEPLDLGKARVRVDGLLRPLYSQLQDRKPIEGLRLGLSALPSDSSPSEIVAAFPVILGALRHGCELTSPDPELGQVEDLLRLYWRQTPSKAKVEGLSAYLATVSDHGMNASTFTARVVASTKAERLDAVISALGALKGPLHGGAPGPVLDLLDELSLASNIEQRLTAKLMAGERLMGFGHRVYKTRDPRAEVLRGALEKQESSERLKLAQRVEQSAVAVLAKVKPGRALHTNVEFYTAVLLDQLGFERDLFTPLFATGRVLGWLAHYQEQTDEGRLIRPSARYVGSEPALA